MRFVWLIGMGLVVGLLAGQTLKGSSFSVIMLVGAVTVAVIELVGVWRRAKGS